MIPFEVLTAFALASCVLALAPGPDNIFVLTQSALEGARAGLVVVLGLCTGILVHSAAVALGVAALIQSNTAAFTLLKFLGAAYLIYLAYQAFRAPAQPLGGAPARRGTGALYRRGLIMNLTNPKVAIFFLAFFPQFTDPARGSMVWQIAGLGTTFMAVTLIVFGTIAMAAGQLRDWLAGTPSAQNVINKIAGLVFLGLAAKIATSKL